MSGRIEAPELVVLDLAGTTVRDHGEVADAFREALEEHGIVAAPEAIAAVRGAAKREAVWRFVAGAEDRERRAAIIHGAFRARLVRRFRRDGVHETPGAGATLRTLRARGIKLALDTGFDRETTELLVDALEWRDLVDAIVCGDDVEHGRPAPDLILRAIEATKTRGADAVAAVGDTALDLEAGRRAGVRWNVGVLSGAHGRERLESAPHTHLIASVAELPGLWPEREEAG